MHNMRWPIHLWKSNAEAYSARCCSCICIQRATGCACPEVTAHQISVNTVTQKNHAHDTNQRMEKRAAQKLTAPAAAAAFSVPMEVRFLRSKHSRTPSSPAQPKRPCTLDMPQALMPGDFAGRGDRKRPSARFNLHMDSCS